MNCPLCGHADHPNEDHVTAYCGFRDTPDSQPCRCMGPGVKWQNPSPDPVLKPPSGKCSTCDHPAHVFPCNVPATYNGIPTLCGCLGYHLVPGAAIPTPDPTPEPPRIPVPKNTEEREFWLDAFGTYGPMIVDLYMGQDNTAGDTARRSMQLPETREELRQCIRTGAFLADVALEEAQFRACVAKDSRKPKKRTKARTPRKVAKRK